MNIKQFDYNARTYPMQSNPYSNLLSVLVLSIHHASHHHEHPAQ